MKNEHRYDKGIAQAQSFGDGFLRARVTIARPGVFPYLTRDGNIRWEAKLPEDLFSDITINTAKGAPVTDGHPPIDDANGMVTPENYTKYIKGSLGDSIVIRDGMLEATETVFDAQLINDLKQGKKVEVSIGFITDVDYTPGEYNGMRYDARQTNIRINHIAHVEAGRAGEKVRAYLDTDYPYAVMTETNYRRDVKMDILEALKKLLAALGIALNDNTENASSENGKNSEGAANESKEGNDTEEKMADASDIAKLKELIKKQQAKIDALEEILKKKKEEQKRNDEAVRIDEAVKKRLALIDAAKSVVPEYKYDGESERDLKLKIINKILPFESSVKIDTLDDVYIDARYDAALQFAKEKANIDIGNNAVRIDEHAIEEKKKKRLQLMEG
ncbi:MAG: DUF2213 domain-containing protein [Spirochaetota bacterium]